VDWQLFNVLHMQHLRRDNIDYYHVYKAGCDSRI